MTLMIRFCSNCKTERPLSEFFCEGVIATQKCGWNLIDEPIRQEGWRPPNIITAATLPPVTRLLTCMNGHVLDAGDLICPTCGEAPASETSTPAGETEPVQPQVTLEQETVIDGWRLLSLLSSTPRIRDRYVVAKVDTGQEAVLSLYQYGAEPDPAVYEVLQRLPLQHAPEIYTQGRWNDRMYEVSEKLNGGSLNDLGIVATDIESIKRIVTELGEALHSFSEVGLRHRDIRPSTLLVRNREPLDLVITGFDSARLSEFDLDIVSPLEVTRYMAPEAIAGGVAAASDWWSLGMVLLEQVTGGACFEGINERAYLIHILANGITLPDTLDPSIELLLRGLLAKDRHQRWQWHQVKAWLAGDQVAAPPRLTHIDDNANAATIQLGNKKYRQPILFALAAAESQNWAQARDLLLRGNLVTWAQEVKVSNKTLAGLRHIAQHESLHEDFRLMIALKLLNPEMPLIHGGNIVTPRWLLDHPLEGYELISGVIPNLLDQLDTESWLSRLKARTDVVRLRAKNLGIELDENSLRVNVLSTSRARLAAVWEERRRLLPDSTHHGLLSLVERTSISEEDLIVLLSASIGQFRSCDAIIEEARELAQANGITDFDIEKAKSTIALPRLNVMQSINETIAGFAHCPYPTLNIWADQFRLERRISLTKALVLLSVPENKWQASKKQEYISQLLGFFEKRISTTVMRGPLVRMTIGKSTARVDLCELGTDRVTAPAILDHLLQRNQQPIRLDPSAFNLEGTTEARLYSLTRNTLLYKRDTGIDGLYLGFPFLLAQDAKSTIKTRIAPLLLWPVKIHNELGNRGIVSLAFDNDREEVRINPALEGMIGSEAAKRWRQAAEELLNKSTLRALEVMNAFGLLAQPRSRVLKNLASPSTSLPLRTEELDCSAVLFHMTFIGQAIGEDMRLLKGHSPAGTSLETALRLNSSDQSAADTQSPPAEITRELERFFTVPSDPSQEAAVLQARAAPGLLVEGPPGTGKSQTIVNMVGDAIGRRKSLLIVCQKHTALEVVHKRLVAEGLNDRIIMINDVNKDRNPVIKRVREQIEALHKRTNDPCTDIRRRREAIAARIESLENEIDRHHTALHKIDEQYGMSYRTLLGELIELESPSPPLDIPALRPQLLKLDAGKLATLEEEIAPLARYWLPAKYEHNPLCELLHFPPEKATLEEFIDTFEKFVKTEHIRATVIQNRITDFDVDDPTLHKKWLDTYCHKFMELSDRQWLLLARWLPFIRSNEQSENTGQHIQSQLTTLVIELGKCSIPHHDQQLSPVLCQLSPKELNQLTEITVEMTMDTSWIHCLNPMRYWRSRKVYNFLQQHGDKATRDRILTLKHACQLERKWHPLRENLAKVHELLQLPVIKNDAGLTLLTEATNTSATFQDITNISNWLALAPSVELMDATACQGTREAMLKLFAHFDAAFARFDARHDSLSALGILEKWIDAKWVTKCRNAILNNISNLARFQPIQNALPTLASYQYFRGRAQRLSTEALAMFAILRSKEAQLQSIPIASLEDEIRRILNRETRLSWKHAMEATEPYLQIEHTEIKSKVINLAKLDLEIRDLNRELLKHDFDLPNIRRLSDWTDITRLTGQRARRLREFIELGADLGLMKLRPVWLMNPDVASRVLPLKAGLFDSVIYDEASQIPIEHALPTLYRGQISIVSGDEKQMPPTSFFSSKVESDEAEEFDGAILDEDATEEEREVFEETWNRREIKDCPDLLQLARTNLPNSTLLIHYRSAYRELIGYSNACFYGNNLSVPVRHPESTVRKACPIKVIRTDSCYQEQTNLGEANKVIEELAAIWRRPYHERPSIGVITFNRKQASLIEDLLEKRAEQDNEFRQAYREESERLEDGEDMGLFVKNVENAQGDERDVIIFSSTFGRNSQGTFRRSFGVLGQQGGERRLNVAVTRARKKIIMITSMPIADISDLLSTHRSPASPRDFLQGYMEYARAISSGEYETSRALLRRMISTGNNNSHGSHKQIIDGFSKSVSEYIQTLGWKVTTSTEDDVFGLDFAIEDPKTGLFAIGIECDAPHHELLKKARSREVWRPSVLIKAVKRIHRVSSHAWYHSAFHERERLKLAIHESMNLTREPA